MIANSDDARLLQAQALHQVGRIERAAELYREVLADHPDHAAAHHLLGLACSQQGAVEPALAHLRRAVSLDGDEPIYHNNLGEALRRAGDLDAAVGSFRRALALRPAFAEAHNNLAITLKGLERLREAILHFEQAIAIRPSYTRARQGLADAFAALDRTRAPADGGAASGAVTEDARGQLSSQFGRRIAFVDRSTPDYAVDTPYEEPLGGSQSAVCYLAEQLAARGHRIHLVSRVSRPRVVRGVDCLTLPDDPADVAGLLDWLGVEVAVLVNAPPQSPLASVRPRTRLVMWNQHAHDQSAVRDLADPAVRDLLDGIAFVSCWQRDEYLAGFDLAPERCRVMPNGVSPAFLDLFGADERILDAKREPILAYASAPYRGLDLLLDVFPAIRAAVPAARLRIFSSMLTYHRGDTEPQYAPLYERARQMPGVEYVGGVPQAELAAALRHTAVLAYPNTFPETFCITALEAMAAGCQVVTSDLGALRETTAGFARLVSWDKGPEAYRAEFVRGVVEALAAADDPAAEDGLRRQVADVTRSARWEARAAEWAAWVEELV